MYVDKLKDKILEQQDIYRRLKIGDSSMVCYKKTEDKVYGTKDDNYINRMRLAYYLLYEKIDDEEVIAYLFREELKDRETNSFQGIGYTIQVLTCLLRKYNIGRKYDELFDRAKKANFDCACGYDVGVEISDDLYGNKLMDCIYLCQDLDYKDIMEQLVEEWKGTITEWNERDRYTLIRFNDFLERKADNEALLREQLKDAAETGKTFQVISAYKDIVQYYLSLKKYDMAYTYLHEVLETTNHEEIRNLRLFGHLLEAACEIICHYSDGVEYLWQWAKPELQEQVRSGKAFGNLYTKGIDAARAVGDPYALQLKKEYADWREKVGLRT